MAHNELEHLQYNNTKAEYDLQKYAWTANAQ